MVEGSGFRGRHEQGPARDSTRIMGRFGGDSRTGIQLLLGFRVQSYFGNSHEKVNGT